MAVFNERRLIGNAIRGQEYIYPNDLREPEQTNIKKCTAYFTHLMKGVSDEAKQRIINDGGFKGNIKKYDEDETGASLASRFSWWSVYIDNDNAERIRNAALSCNQEPSYICDDEGGNMFGSNMFIEKLDKLIDSYEKCIEGKAEIRVLSTFEYTRQIEHAVVVVPKKFEKFQDHDLFAERDDGGVYTFHMEHIMKNGNNRPGYQFEWYPFSTVKWDADADFPKQRRYAHLAFAFCLDPLPCNIMLVPGVQTVEQWMECDSIFQLLRPLIE